MMRYFKTETNEIRAIDEGQEFLIDDGWDEVSEVEAIVFIESMEPEKTQEQINAEHRAYLSSTDWYVTRKMETGDEIPQDILDARQAAREGVVE